MTGGTILGRGRGSEPSDEARHVDASFVELAEQPVSEPAHREREPALPGRAGPSAPPRWTLAVCLVAAVAALVFALLALQQRRSLQSEHDQTNELRDVSGRTVAALTSYDYQHLDQWKKSVLANATGSFQNQFESGFGGFEQAYIAEHNRGTGTIQGVWVGPIDAEAGKATTVVLVNMAVTSLTGTHSLEPYIQVFLLKVAGRWRVDDVQATFDTTGTGGSASVPVPTTAPPGRSTATSSP